MSWANGDSRDLGGIAVPSYSSPTTQTNSSFPQRRRSSAAHTRPAAPPPNQPIPSIPQDLAEFNEELPPTNGYSRPSTRSSSFAAQQPSSHSSASSSVDDLSDPPPQSILLTSSSRFNDPTVDHLAAPAADGHLMPPDNRAEARIPSPRRALTRALELAREAVQLDSMNDNPELAVAAYGRSVALLSEVMERVKRGEESTERRKNRGRSVFAQEDEIRRLQAIVSLTFRLYDVFNLLVA